MNKTIMHSIFILLLSVLLFLNTAWAGKVQNSTSYIKKFDTVLDPISESLDILKIILDSNNNVGSFITTSFWGFQPSWYLHHMGDLSLEYTFSQHLTNLFKPWDQHPSYAVRNVNGVVFTPLQRGGNPKGEACGINLSIDFNLCPGSGNLSRCQNDIKRSFLTSGIPQDQLDAAMDYFEQRIDPLLTKIEQKVYAKYDNLFSGNTKNGSYSDYIQVGRDLERNGSINEDDFLIPSRHRNIFTEQAFADSEKSLNMGSLAEFYRINEQKYKEQKLSLLQFYASMPPHIGISASAQPFLIAGRSDKSERFNQLQQLKTMLEKKVKTGKAVKIARDNYFVYQDATGNGLYKGELGINYTTGYGYWQLPVVGAKAVMDTANKTIKTEVSNFNKIIIDYFALCKKETIAKFANNGGQTNDF